MPNLALHRELLLSDDLRGLCASSVTLVNSAIGARATSIFLYSKRGTLVRFAHAGIHGDTAESFWPSEDAVGRCVSAAAGEKYGEIQRSLAPHGELSDKTLALYREVLPAAEVICLPLNGPNRTYGVLRCIGRIIEEGEAETYDNSDVSALTVFAHQLAISMSSVRRKLELDVNAQITSLLAEYTDSTHVCQHVAEALVGELTEFAACSIRLMNWEGDLKLSYLAAADGVTRHPPDHIIRRVDQGFARQALETRTVVVVASIQSRLAEFYSPAWLAENNFQTCAVFPIALSDTEIGILTLYLWYSFAFAETRIRFIESICQQLATAINLTREVASRQQMIDRMNQIISPSLSIAEVLKRILESACLLTEGSQGYIALTSRKDRLLHPRAATANLPLEAVPLIDIEGRGISASAARERRPVRCNDVHEDAFRALFVDFKTPKAGVVKAELIVPLLSDDRLLGVIAIQSDHRNCFTASAETLLETFARYASVVFERDRIQDATERLATLGFSHTERTSVYHAIVETATTLSDADVTMLGIVESSTGNLDIVSWRPHGILRENADYRQLPKAKGVTWRALQDREIVIVPDVNLEQSFYHSGFANANDLRTLVVIPLFLSGTGVAADAPLGAILIFYRQIMSLSASELALLRAFATSASYAVHDLASVEARDRTRTLVSVTARVQGALELSQRMAEKVAEPLRIIQDEIGNISACLGSGASFDVDTLRAAAADLSGQLGVGRAGLDFGGHAWTTDGLDIESEAARLLQEGSLKGIAQASIRIGLEELWSNVERALVRIAERLKLPMAVAYRSSHRNYSALERVASFSKSDKIAPQIGLRSFDEFLWLCNVTSAHLPSERESFSWLNPRTFFDVEQALLFGREIIGGHLLILAFGMRAEPVLSSAELIALHEVVTNELMRYIDSSMFGIELDYLTSETGHLMGRAVGKVEAGIKTIQRLLEPGVRDRADRTEFRLARRTLEDGVVRLQIIRQNFYAFSALRRGVDLLPSEMRHATDAMSERFDVVAMLRNMSTYFSEEAEAREKKFTRYHLTSRAAWVSGSPYLLRMVFYNLFDNAVKFSYRNTFIEISAAANDRLCTITFENLGLGVASDEFNAVFQPLRRSRYRNPKQRIEGLGLGLSYCRRITEEIFKGKIRLESHEVDTPRRRFDGDNWLTTVTIQLPIT
jgi:GAF domain-containing protein